MTDFYKDRTQKLSAEGAFLADFRTSLQSPGHSAMGVALDAAGRGWSANFTGNPVQQWSPMRAP